MATDGKKVRKRVQYGALFYRETADGLEILLVTSHGSRRWIIPKGWPIRGLEPCRLAAQEVYEEAGVRGKVSLRSMGSYVYDKFLDAKAITVSSKFGHRRSLKIKKTA